MIFKKGDKVKRIVDNFCEAVVGGIYTVNEYNEQSFSITLEGLDGMYDMSRFELVGEEEQLINFLP